MENKKKVLPTYIMIGTILLVILWFNISYFNHRTSSNAQSISEYNLSDEDIAPDPQPAVASVFYKADVYQTDSDADGVIEQITSSQRYCPKIIIVPQEGLRDAAKIATGAYDRLGQCANKIKNVFILGSAHTRAKQLFIPSDNVIKTPLGDLPINQQIIGTLLKDNLFKLNSNFFNHKNSIKIQLPFLQKTLNSFKIVPISYGRVDGDIIADKLRKFLVDKGNVIIVTSDLMVLNNEEEDGKALQEINRIGIQTSLRLSKDFGLVPQILDITNIGDEEISFGNIKMGGWKYEEAKEQKVLLGVELFHNNIKNFVRHYQDELISIIKSSVKSAEKHRHYRVKRKKYNNYLFNQGASYITLHFVDASTIGFGSIYAYKAVAADIADNIYHLLNDSDIMQKLKDTKVDLKVELLTKPEEIEFISYENLLTQITPKVDGLIIKSGKREGFLLPSFWRNVKSKDDFMVQLKMKAGLSPTYWSDDVKIFRFRTVEIN